MMFRYTAQVALDANQVQSVYSLGIQYSLSRPCHNTPVVMSCFALLHAYRFSDCFSQLQLLVHTLHPHSAVYDVSQSAHRLHTLSSAAPGQVVTAYMHCLYALLICIALASTAASCKCPARVHVWRTAPVAKQYMWSSAGNE